MKAFGYILLGAFLGFGLSQTFFIKIDKNSELTYGESGFPKNCRAIIKANIDGYTDGDYEAYAALDSINRNCGEDGYSW